MGSDSKTVDIVGSASGDGGGQGELVKATLTPLGIYLGKDPSKKGGFPEGEPITVLFNPKEFTLEKSVSWQFHATAGREADLLEYTGSDGESLSFRLFADTSRQAKDVRAFTEQIRALTYPDEQLGHPRVVRFDWGTFSFKGFIVKLVQVFTHHLREGVPVRATLDITIKELDLKPGGNTDPNEKPDTETGTDRMGRGGRGGGTTESGTDGGRDVDPRATSGGNESMTEPSTEGRRDARGREAGGGTEGGTEARRDERGREVGGSTEGGTEGRRDERGREVGGGAGGGGHETGTEGDRDVDARSTSGGNESMGEPGAEGNAEADTEGGGNNNDAPWVKLGHIWPPGGVVEGVQHWDCYHHSAVYIQLHVKNVKKIKLTITPYLGGDFSLYINGFWHQATPGEAAPKDGVFKMGGVGKTSPSEAAHESNGKCHFLQKYGTQFGPKGHPSLHLVAIGLQTVNGDNTTQALDYDKWVIALQPRKPGQFTIEAKGVGPYDVPLKAGGEDPKDTIVVNVKEWTKIGD